MRIPESKERLNNLKEITPMCKFCKMKHAQSKERKCKKYQPQKWQSDKQRMATVKRNNLKGAE